MGNGMWDVKRIKPYLYAVVDPKGKECNKFTHSQFAWDWIRKNISKDAYLASKYKMVY